MCRYLRIYRVFLTQYLKRLVQYRTDFLIGMSSFLLIQFSGILFISCVFAQIKSLNGWNLDEMIFIYGFFQLPRGIDHLLTDNIWLIPRYIKRGDIDRYLVRPINPLFQCIAERFQPEAFGELTIGVILINLSMQRLKLPFTGPMIAWMCLFVLCGALIYTSIKLIGASIGFWIMNSMPLMTFVYQFADFAKYPTLIFPKFIQALVTFVIPFAFVSYYPSAYFLGKGNLAPAVIGSLAATVILTTLAYRCWLKGLAGYTSAGN